MSREVLNLQGRELHNQPGNVASVFECTLGNFFFLRLNGSYIPVYELCPVLSPHSSNSTLLALARRIREMWFHMHNDLFSAWERVEHINLEKYLYHLYFSQKTSMIYMESTARPRQANRTTISISSEYIIEKLMAWVSTISNQRIWPDSSYILLPS